MTITTSINVREINQAIKDSAHVYCTRQGDPNARCISIIRAKSEQGRLRVLTRHGNWQGIGGIYVVRIERGE